MYRIKNILSDKKYFFISFALGCVIFLVSALPFAAQNDGIFYYYGDFTYQQQPFTLGFVKDTSMPQFDFNAGTGMDYLDAYSFYNLFSPFNLIFRLFPEAALYLFPYVIALKFGFCSANAYLYISRFCKNGSLSAAGGLLYAFSGYTLVTFVYHYLDALVFFPLLLAALEYAVTEKQRGIFGVTVTVCALTNYYIFGTEAIFLIIYFLVRLTDSSFRISLKDFFCLAAETVLGLAAAGIVLIPAAAYILNSPRLGSSFGSIGEMLIYETPWRYARILQAIFLPPDIQGYTNFFPDFRGDYPAGSRWSSQALYIPLFGISGAAAYISANKKSWASKLIIICAVIAFVPVLNSVFSLGSSLYYARWMFAPTLIMSCMTVKALENEPKHFGAGLMISGAAIAAAAVFTLLFPMEKLAMWESTVYYSAPQRWTQVICAAAGVIVTSLVVFSMTRDGQFPTKILALTAAAVFIITEATMLFGMGEDRYPQETIYALSNSPNIEKSEYGKRIAAESNLDNMNILWDIPSVYIFHSIVSPYLNEYCEASGIAPDEIIDDYPSQCLFSAKEMIEYDHSIIGHKDTPSCEADGDYTYSYTDGKYIVYENENFIPMGFCYDYYIPEEEFLALDKETRNRLMLKAMAVGDAAAASGYLEKIPDSEIYALSDEDLAAECAERAKTSAHSFVTDGESYTAEITLEKPELVFFSINYSDDFTAFVDGEETETVRANFGFQAIPVPAGTHTVKTVYRSRSRAAGTVCSVLGTAGLAVYAAAAYVLKRGGRKNAQKES